MKKKMPVFIGAVFGSLLLFVQPVSAATAPTATTQAAAGMSNTVATLNGTVNPGGTNTTAWFEWGLSPFTNTSLTAPVAVGSGASSVAVSNLLSGLTPGLIYHCRLVASNALGVVRGSDVRFGSPALALNGATVMTNECHAAFADTGATATGVPLAIAGGGYHSLALKSDGTVVAWGDTTYVPVGLSNVVAIAGGGLHSLALKSDRTVFAWGDNFSGQTNIPVGLSNVVAIAGGGYHSLALKSDGTVAAWGRNLEGQTNVPVGLSNVVAIVGGGLHSLALKSDGTVAVWGYSYYYLTTIPVGWSNVLAIAGGLYHILALKSDGTVTAWGYNASGQTTIPVGLNTLTVTVSGSVNTNSPGSYMLTHTATNILGGSATATRTVVVRDTIPPVITLNGSNPILFTNANRLFTDPGATALDLCGGALTVNVSNPVNPNIGGTYTITYTATDSSGNSTTNTRTVFVALPQAIPGDANGDGIVSQSELDAVYANYVTNSPWLALTNVAGLGGTNVTFTLSNTIAGGYTAEYSTNLANWFPLGPATPRYLFTDTNASGQPQRYYRLRYP